MASRLATQWGKQPGEYCMICAVSLLVTRHLCSDELDQQSVSFQSLRSLASHRGIQDRGQRGFGDRYLMGLHQYDESEWASLEYGTCITFDLTGKGFHLPAPLELEHASSWLAYNSPFAPRNSA